MILSKEESIAYVGGGKISAAMISAATSLFRSIYEMGQNFGSTIRRLIAGKTC